MNCELDAENRLQALVAKDRIRIKEFFIDFDKLRKGFVGEAAVSIFSFLWFYVMEVEIQNICLLTPSIISFSYGI